MVGNRLEPVIGLLLVGLLLIGIHPVRCAILDHCAILVDQRLPLVLAAAERLMHNMNQELDQHV
jgi:hypothetical protein